MPLPSIAPWARLFAVSGLWMTLGGAVQAGRPLTVDDASVNEVRTCQIEAWLDRTDHTNTTVPGFACGVWDGLELGLGLGVPHHTSRSDSARSVSLKYVPPGWEWQGWKLGGKLAFGSVRPAGQSHWEDAPVNVSGLASRPLGDEWTVHVNAGMDFAQRPREQRATAGLALAWTPQERWVLFAEVFGTEKSGATRGAGARYWLIPEVLGLDATAQRTNTGGGITTYTLGVGWYGLAF